MACHHAFYTRVRVGNGDEPEFVDLCLTLARIAARRFRASTVAVVLYQYDILIRLALTELVRAGADELHQRIGDGFLRHDAGVTGGEGEMRQQGRLHFREDDLDRGRPFGGDGRDAFGERLAARRHLHPALQRGNDILGIEIASVMQLDALAQLDRVGLAVRRHLRHLGGQHGLHGPLGVKSEERFVDVLHDQADEVGGRRHRIEGLRLRNHRQVGGARRLRRCQTRREQCESCRSRRGEPQSTPRGRASHIHASVHADLPIRARLTRAFPFAPRSR